MQSYIRYFFQHAPGKVALGGILMLTSALMEGVGLLILIPLLALVGVDAAPDSGTLNQLSAWLNENDIHMSLPLILCGFVTLIMIQAWLLRKRTLVLYALQLTFVDKLRMQLYQALTRSNWTFLSTRHSTDFKHILTVNIQRVGSGTHHLLNLTATLVMMTAYFVVAVQLSVAVTLLALACGSILWLLLRRENRRCTRAGEQLTRSHRRIHYHLDEHLANMHLIKSHGLHGAQIQLFEHEVDQQRFNQIKFNEIHSRVSMLYKILGALTLAVLVYSAVDLLELPGATVLVLIAIFARVLPMLSSFQSGVQQVLHMLPVFRSWQELLAECELHKERLSPRQQPVRLQRAIRMDQLQYCYPRGEFRLEIAQLEMPAGKHTAIVGASGSGKSTLIDLLLGLYRPDSGQVLIDDQPLDDTNIGSWRDQIAYVPQETQLFDLTLRENLSWGVAVIPEDNAIYQVLDQVGLKELINALPNGLDTRMGEGGNQFSGGERQRLALVSALLKKPSCLILDEATSALGSIHQQAVSHLLASLPDEMTVIIIAHQLETIQHADQVIFLENGQIKRSGDRHEMQQSIVKLFAPT